MAVRGFSCVWRMHALVALLALAIPSVAHADCAERLENLNALLRAGNSQQAHVVVEQVSDDAACSGAEILAARRAGVAALLRVAAKVQNLPDQASEYESLVRQAADMQVSYEADWRLADLELKNKNFKIAALYYQRAIELLDAEISAPGVSRKQRAQLETVGGFLVKRADEARQLAASASKPVFVSALPNHRGELGGVYSDAFGRGIEAEKVPPPITFDYDSVTFTAVGTEAADELLVLLKTRHPVHITVVGHTDQKGSGEYNLDLSKRRAEAVIAYLRKNGVEARFVAEGKGKREPRDISTNAGYTPDEIDQLNRRVEIDWGN